MQGEQSGFLCFALATWNGSKGDGERPLTQCVNTCKTWCCAPYGNITALSKQESEEQPELISRGCHALGY